jgi:hypothetical protein
MKSQNGSFGIAKDYGLDSQGIGVKILDRGKRFSSSP